MAAADAVARRGEVDPLADGGVGRHDDALAGRALEFDATSPEPGDGDAEVALGSPVMLRMRIS